LKFVPGLALRDVPRGGGGKAMGSGDDANTAEVESVSIQAHTQRRVSLDRSSIVNPAGGDEEVHPIVLQLEVPSLTKFQRQFCTARTMKWIPPLVLPTGIMKQREEADHLLVDLMMPGQVEPIAKHRHPMRGPMAGASPEPELGGNEFPKRLFWQ
jgi:hypothetical protein